MMEYMSHRSSKYQRISLHGPCKASYHCLLGHSSLAIVKSFVAGDGLATFGMRSRGEALRGKESYSLGDLLYAIMICLGVTCEMNSDGNLRLDRWWEPIESLFIQLENLIFGII